MRRKKNKMRLTWATDIHLDFITNENSVAVTSHNLDIFCSLFEQSDAVVLSGDISQAPLLRNHLSALEVRLQRPIYFVLGNHDFWGSNTSRTRNEMTRLSNVSEYLRYLSAIPYIELSKDTFMVGHDGWYDGLYSEPKFSNFVMNDWTQIGDYTTRGGNWHDHHDFILEVARQQSTLAAQHVATGIKNVLSQRNPRKIIVVTHVPPFIQPLELSRENKKDLYPWYSSKIMGDMLLTAAANNPRVSFEVFCGHCHIKYDGQITPNLLLHSGGSEYSEPRPQFTFDVSL